MQASCLGSLHPFLSGVMTQFHFAFGQSIRCLSDQKQLSSPMAQR